MRTEYTVYGGALSYFTRKLEAAMLLYGAPFHVEAKGRGNREAVEQRAAWHRIPVIQTPEDWMIGDTTPILQLLDTRYPQRRMFPTGPLGVLVHVVEEYFDEWLPRTALHYRWQRDESTRFVVSAMIRSANPDADEKAVDAAIESGIASWGRRACRATGVDSEVQQRAAEQEYARLLAGLDRQLASTAFALGDRPSAVDAVLLGGLRAHFLHDPAPRSVVELYPRIVEWTEKGADAWSGGGDWAPFPESTEFARAVLAEARETYRPFVLGNRRALERGDKAFVIEIYGEPVSYLAREYPEQSRLMIRDRIASQLDASERRQVLDWLDSVGLRDCFWED